MWLDKTYSHRGGEIVDEEEGRGKSCRKSKDRKINAEGKRLCGYLEERGWGILSGNVQGDEEGELTYIGRRGNSVIDYILGNDETREGVERVEVGDKIDSDHLPVIVWIKGKEEEEAVRGGEGSRKTIREWNREMVKKFRETFGEKEEMEGSVEEDWEKLRNRVKAALEEVGKGNRGKKKGWWDEECKREKRKVRAEMRRWKKKGGEGMEVKEMKKKYRMLCEEKKRKEREEWEEKAKRVKTEKEIWKLINKERKKRIGINEGIKLEEWEGYFRELLGGVERRVRWGERRGRGEDDLEQIGREEIREVIKRLKEGKAAGGDGIPNEVWKFGGEEVVEWLWRVCNGVWRGEGWPDDWTEGMVVLIAKKKDSKELRDYRGITLTQTAYKIYAAVLAERLRREVEEKRILPPSQTGFRRGLGCMDNIYVLNYLINRQVERRERKMVVLFMDLRAAFDSVERGKLAGAMREMG